MCNKQLSFDLVAQFLAAVHAVPWVHFCILYVDELAVDVRNRCLQAVVAVDPMFSMVSSTADTDAGNAKHANAAVLWDFIMQCGRNRLVGVILDAEHPLRTCVEEGLILVFRSQTGVDAFESTLNDVTDTVEATPSGFVRDFFGSRGLKSRVQCITLVAGRAGDGKTAAIRDDLGSKDVRNTITISVHEDPVYVVYSRTIRGFRFLQKGCMATKTRRAGVAVRLVPTAVGAQVHPRKASGVGR